MSDRQEVTRRASNLAAAESPEASQLAEASGREERRFGELVQWNMDSKGANVSVSAGGVVTINGYGTIMSAQGVLAGGGGEAHWEVDFNQTGRGSWVGLVAVPVAVEGGHDSGRAWPNGDLPLSAIGWALWGGETGGFHPMYIKGKSVAQIVGFRSGQTVGLRLKPVASAPEARASSGNSAFGTSSSAACPPPHSLIYLIDGEEVCEAFTAAELPQDGAVTLHLAISNAQGWAGTTRARGRRL